MILVWRPPRGKWTNNADQDQNATSDQGLHCFTNRGMGRVFNLKGLNLYIGAKPFGQSYVATVLIKTSVCQAPVFDR